MNEDQNTAAEDVKKNELLFALKNRKRTGMFFISTESYQQQKALKQWLADECPEYQFQDIDLTPTNVSSLNYELKRQLPDEVVHSKPVQYVVNVFGLENSLIASEDGKIVTSNLTAQLNFERENLFKVPYVTILWADRSFFVTLQRESPDLSHWVNYIFHFEDETTRESYGEKSTEIPETIETKGFIPERNERLIELEAKYEKLALNTADKERLIKDKVDLLIAIADEYKAQPNYQKAKEKLEIALSLAKRTEMTHLLGKIYYKLGATSHGLRHFEDAINYFENAKQNLSGSNYGLIYHYIGIVFQEQRKWPEALENYQLTIQWKEKTGNQFALGSTYHQIGMVFEAQRKWKEALENYQLAIEWNEKTGNQFALGSTYHQIGRVFEEQRKWNEALENYQQAIEWNEKTGNQFALGSTYHQIGRVFEEQRKWQEALENYQLAIEWNEKTGNEFALGVTYHQIGMVFEEQRKWKEALENYQLAIEFYEKTGNEYELGDTYHQIGMVFAEQGELKQALEYFQMAVSNLQKYDHPNLPIAEESLSRVEQALKDQQ